MRSQYKKVSKSHEIYTALKTAWLFFPSLLYSLGRKDRTVVLHNPAKILANSVVNWWGQLFNRKWASVYELSWQFNLIVNFLFFFVIMKKPASSNVKTKMCKTKKCKIYQILILTRCLYLKRLNFVALRPCSGTPHFKFSECGLWTILQFILTTKLL